MAENEQERTEQPTPKRLEEARKKGQLPRSMELSAAAVILTVGGGLHFLGGYMGGRLNGLMATSLSLTREQSLDESLMFPTMTTEAGACIARVCPDSGSDIGCGAGGTHAAGRLESQLRGACARLHPPQPDVRLRADVLEP